jgi:hypothetical protein
MARTKPLASQLSFDASEISGSYLSFVGNSSSYSGVNGGPVLVGASPGYRGLRFGRSPLWQETSEGSYNISIGDYALASLDSGDYNTALGHFALENSNGEGSDYNIAIGLEALRELTTGSDNIGIGMHAGRYSTTGVRNTIIGKEAMSSSRTGTNNVVIGERAGATMGLPQGDAPYDNASANSFNNTIVGQRAARYAHSISSSTLIGQYAGYYMGMSNTNSTYNVGVGYAALSGNRFWNVSGDYPTGTYNVGVGAITLSRLTSGGYNTAVGTEAAQNMSTGSYNVAIGRDAMYWESAGLRNVAVGSNSAFSNEGNDNVFVGASAGAGAWYATGATYIGAEAGDLSGTTGDYNICIGYQAKPASTAATQTITLGNANITTLRCNTQTISSLSDERDKDNITDLSLGLDYINAVRPVEFDWNRRDGSMEGIHAAGFIAQELDQVESDFNTQWLGTVYKDNPEKLEASPGKLLPIMVKAIQELSQEVERLKGIINGS